MNIQVSIQVTEADIGCLRLLEATKGRCQHFYVSKPKYSYVCYMSFHRYRDAELIESIRLNFEDRSNEDRRAVGRKINSRNVRVNH